MASSSNHIEDHLQNHLERLDLHLTPSLLEKFVGIHIMKIAIITVVHSHQVNRQWRFDTDRVLNHRIITRLYRGKIHLAEGPHRPVILARMRLLHQGINIAEVLVVTCHLTVITRLPFRERRVTKSRLRRLMKVLPHQQNSLGPVSKRISKNHHLLSKRRKNPRR